MVDPVLDSIVDTNGVSQGTGSKKRRMVFVDVLFVCVHNSGRSQMAEALFNHLADRRRIDLAAASAGTHPAKAVLPLVGTVMTERGIDVSLQIPRLLTDELVQSSQKVITMGCEVDTASCPSLIYKTATDWQLSDPSVMGIEQVRALRDEIYDKVDRLLTYMTRPIAQEHET